MCKHLYYEVDDDGAIILDGKGKQVIARMHKLMWIYFLDDILIDWRHQPIDNKNAVILALHREFLNPIGY